MINVMVHQDIDFEMKTISLIRVFAHYSTGTRNLVHRARCSKWGSVWVLNRTASPCSIFMAYNDIDGQAIFAARTFYDMKDIIHCEIPKFLRTSFSARDCHGLSNQDN